MVSVFINFPNKIIFLEIMRFITDDSCNYFKHDNVRQFTVYCNRMKNKIKSIKTIYNTLRYNYLLRQKSSVKPSNPDLIKNFLDKYKEHNTVIVHIGLEPIRKSFAKNPYNFTIKLLTERFNNIIAPGFTPSFKKTGVYHKLFSCPEYGMFSKLFMHDATTRTNDPVYSLLIYGSYSFNDKHCEESFGIGSCFDQLDNDNVLCINIGTKWLVSSQLHFIEYTNNVPYIEKNKYEGVIYYDESNYSKTSVINYYNKHWFNKYVSILWNRYKISRHLYNSGIVDYYNINGVKLYSFRVGDMKRFIDEKIKKDPLYLIT